MLVSIAWIVWVIWSFRFVNFKIKNKDWTEYGAGIVWILWGASAIVVFLIVGCALENNIAALVNPEYWALKQILP